MSNSPTIIERLPPIHPGEILREEFLVPLSLTAGRLARRIGVPRTRIERIVDRKIGITADTAVRLSRAFGNSPQFWLNLQSHYDLQLAETSLKEELDKIETIGMAAA